MKNYLDFETEIKDIETEINNLKDPYSNDGLTEVDTDKINELQNELDLKLKDSIFEPKPVAKNLVSKT